MPRTKLLLLLLLLLLLSSVQYLDAFLIVPYFVVTIQISVQMWLKSKYFNL